ncbi:MAG: hypothetical protein ACYDAL_02215 [Candidatus Dormibacteraceae bacterium]
MTAVTEVALGLGLEVWFSPNYFEYPLEETTTRLVAAAEAAAPLEAVHPGRVVFVAGSELTLFMQGIVAGKSDAIHKLRAQDSNRRGGRRCLDVPPTGYTVRADSISHPALFSSR